MAGIVHDFLSEKAARTELALHAYLDTWEGAPARLREAVEYSLFAGGKRLRPALVLGAAELVSGNDVVAMPAACALEMIHTYSLIHDDLPAMDNDDMRRGRPTCHIRFGEALAILAGDALLTMAFDVLADTGNPLVIAETARAAGVVGMVGGQTLDLEAENQVLSLDELRHLHSLKTGALIRVSVRSGAILGGADAGSLSALTAYAEHIGLAFQIADDILDVVGTAAALGKPIGSDAARHKSTYPALMGLEASRELADESIRAALVSLEPFGPQAEPFRELAQFIINRDN